MTKTESIFEDASSFYAYNNDNDESQAIMIDAVEQILARAFNAAMAIEDTDLMDEIATEMDIIADWKDFILYCDEEGIDCTNTADFMEAYAA